MPVPHLKRPDAILPKPASIMATASIISVIPFTIPGNLQKRNAAFWQPSRMPGFKTMWIWASRGLTLHRDDSSGAVAWLYAYPPMTVDAFRASWLAKVEIHRTRVR